jgi:hypothetical protein
MKERPIIFSAPMVRAMLDGSKTQTRRIIKWPKEVSIYAGTRSPADPEDCRVLNGRPIYMCGHDSTAFRHVICPYGVVGDRLWVRETHLAWWNTGVDGTKPGFSHVAAYKADGYELESDEKWIPSIHMVRAASRITIEITDVRVERLQDISEEDAIAEGIEYNPKLDPVGPSKWRVYGRPSTGTNVPESSYESLWETINGAGSWALNPFVYVVEFKRVKP